MNLFEYLNCLPEDSATKGRVFEKKILAWFQKDPEWYEQIKSAWLWRDWPQNWGVDRGIDIVLEDFEGRLIAVQVKLRQTDGQVTKAEIDSFLSESNRPIFSYRVLVSTTESLSEGARQVIEGQEKPVYLIGLARLHRSATNWSTLGEERQAKPDLKVKILRPHQLRALEAIKNNLITVSRGQVIMACGTGKTLVSLRAHETIKSRSTLVLVPTLNLMTKTMLDWITDKSEPFKWLSVCSDQTVFPDFESRETQTQIFETPITTDSKQIRDFLMIDGTKVIFSTYASITKVIEASHGFTYDLIICDEAHRLAGVSDKQSVGLLFDDVLSARKRLFFTATPRIFSSTTKRKLENSDLELYSMDDKERFGEVIFQYNFASAIKDDVLSKFQVIISVVSNQEVRGMLEQNTSVKVGDEDVYVRDFAAQIALVKAIKQYNMTSLITFHSQIARAKQFAYNINNALKSMNDTEIQFEAIQADYISGDMPANRRVIRLATLDSASRRNPAIISNSRCLGEGVDVPELSGVAFVDPKQSPIEIVQAMGRAIRRKSKQENIGYVLIPAFIQDSKDDEEVLDSTNFKTILEVLNALKAHDIKFEENLNLMRAELSSSGDVSLFGDSNNVQIIGVEALTRELMKNLQVRMLRSLSEDWYEIFGILKRYCEQNKTASVPQDYITEEGLKLGQWVSVQRTAYRRKQLKKERIKILEELPGWVWNVQQMQLDNAFQELLAHVNKYGSSLISQGFKTSTGYNLGAYVSDLRKKYSEGILDSSQIVELEKLPGWAWSILESKFIEFKSEYEAFFHTFGHCDVETNYISPSGYPLGQRLTSRRASKGAARKSLETLPGWAWSNLRARQNIGLQKLKDYYYLNGNTRVPRDYPPTAGFSLIVFLNSVRTLYRKRRLDIEVIEELESYSDWVWSLQSDIELRKQQEFEKGLLELDDFINRFDTSLVPRLYESPSGFKLGKWVANMRSYKGSGYFLNSERTLSLEARKGWLWQPALSKHDPNIPLPNAIVEIREAAKAETRARKWISKEQKWRLALHEVTEYIENNPDRPCPSKKYRGRVISNLNSWLYKQALAYETNSLSEESKILWEQLPISKFYLVSDNRFANAEDRCAWYQSLDELRLILKEVEAINIDNNLKFRRGVNIVTWIKGQKYRKSRGKLDELSIKELEGLDGWAWTSDPWQDKFKHLQEFYKTFGHTNVPQKYETQELGKLGLWVSNQRQNHRKGKLSNSQKNLLEALPGWRW